MIQTKREVVLQTEAFRLKRKRKLLEDSSIGISRRRGGGGKILYPSLNFPHCHRLELRPQSAKNGGWVSRINNQLQWLQVKFGRKVEIRRIATQGRHRYDQWVKSYSLRFSMDGLLFIQYQTNKNQTVRFCSSRAKSVAKKHCFALGKR